MSLFVLVLIALSAMVAIAGISLAIYASTPEKFLVHANAGRYAGLTTSAHANAVLTREPARVGPLVDQLP